ncbi:MAG TPA: FtsQ-type POTRA domain-containing protein [Candidatus Eisenbacteria bacterium]
MRAGYRGLPTWKKPAIRRRRRRLLLGVAAAVLLFVLTPILAKPSARWLGALPPFRVRTIEVSGLLYLSPEEVRAAIPVKEGDNLLLLDRAAVEASLLRNARIDAARVTRYPGRLSVRIRERRTFVLVSAGSLLEMDARGTILTPLERGLVPDRPVVTGIRLPTAAPGARVTTSRLRDVLRLVSLLESPDVGLLSDVSEIVSEGPNRATLRTSADQIPILVDPERVTRAALRAVAATLRDVRQRNRRVLGVDARYRGQVVVRCAPEDQATTSDAPDARRKA